MLSKEKSKYVFIKLIIFYNKIHLNDFIKLKQVKNAHGVTLF